MEKIRYFFFPVCFSQSSARSCTFPRHFFSFFFVLFSPTIFRTLLFSTQAAMEAIPAAVEAAVEAVEAEAAAIGRRNRRGKPARRRRHRLPGLPVARSRRRRRKRKLPRIPLPKPVFKRQPRQKKLPRPKTLVLFGEGHLVILLQLYQKKKKLYILCKQTKTKRRPLAKTRNFAAI